MRPVNGKGNTQKVSHCFALLYTNHSKNLWSEQHFHFVLVAFHKAKEPVPLLVCALSTGSQPDHFGDWEWDPHHFSLIVWYHIGHRSVSTHYTQEGISTVGGVIEKCCIAARKTIER